MNHILSQSTYYLDQQDPNINNQVYPSLFNETREDQNQQMMIINQMLSLTDKSISETNKCNTKIREPVE